MDNTAKIPVNIPARAASKSVHESAREEPSDREVVERCQRGDLASYELLVSRYRQRV